MVFSPYYKEFKEKPKTYEGLFDHVNDVLKKQISLKEPVETLEYGNLCRGSSGPLPADAMEVFCIVNVGSCEGIYVDCYLRTEGGETKLFALYKTLGESLDAFIKMGMLAGAFTKLAGEYLAAIDL